MKQRYLHRPGATEQMHLLTTAYDEQSVFRIALSDGIPLPYLGALLAICRKEMPDVRIQLSEVPLMTQLDGLRNGLYDVGFAKTDDTGAGLVTRKVWNEQLFVVAPARPLFMKPEVPSLLDLLHHPLVLCETDGWAGYHMQVDRWLNSMPHKPLIAARVSSHELMILLVAAGYGVGVTTESQLAAWCPPKVEIRSLAGFAPLMNTFLLHRDDAPSEILTRFLSFLACPQLRQSQHQRCRFAT